MMLRFEDYEGGALAVWRMYEELAPFTLREWNWNLSCWGFNLLALEAER